jgi:protein TonB
MNIHKYLLPASLAATIHVALLWFLPTEDYIRVMAVPLTPPGPVDPPVQDQPVPPDEEKSPAIEPVKSLLGVPAPISLDEPPVRPIATTFSIPVETVRSDVVVSLNTIPSVIGDPNGDPLGKFRVEPSIFDLRSLDHAPRAKVQLPPEYPATMRHDGRSGSVLVEFDVNAEGRVVRAEAIRYSDREFVEPAVRAVRQWQFEPGRRHNQAVPFRMAVPIEFGLESG